MGNSLEEALRTEIEDEIHQIEIVVGELESLAEDVGAGPASLRDRAAASAFLASFYMGIENILKRIARYHGVEVPRSERWHVALFEQFCPPRKEPLPVLFEGELITQMDAYRRFRHVVHHGYERDLDYARMRTGIDGARQVLDRFSGKVRSYLQFISG